MAELNVSAKTQQEEFHQDHYVKLTILDVTELKRQKKKETACKNEIKGKEG